MPSKLRPLYLLKDDNYIISLHNQGVGPNGICEKLGARNSRSVRRRIHEIQKAQHTATLECFTEVDDYVLRRSYAIGTPHYQYQSRLSRPFPRDCCRQRYFELLPRCKERRFYRQAPHNLPPLGSLGYLPYTLPLMTSKRVEEVKIIDHGSLNTRSSQPRPDANHWPSKVQPHPEEASYSSQVTQMLSTAPPLTTSLIPEEPVAESTLQVRYMIINSRTPNYSRTVWNEGELAGKSLSSLCQELATFTKRPMIHSILFNLKVFQTEINWTVECGNDEGFMAMQDMFAQILGNTTPRPGTSATILLEPDPQARFFEERGMVGSRRFPVLKFSI